MVALTRIMPREELDSGVGFLKDIIAIVKNPKILDEAHEEALKKIALKDEEIKKLAGARKLIADGDKIKAELDAREQAVKAAEDLNLTTKSEFEKVQKAEETRLANLEKELKNTALQHENTGIVLKTAENQLAERKKTQDKEHQEAMRDVDNQREKNRQDRESLSVQASELGKKQQEQENRDAAMLRIVTGK